MAAGSLLVVGTGIMLGAQVTAEALGAIREADVVLALVPDAADGWVRGLNPATESLADCYAPGKRRAQSYDEMVERILRPVREGRRVCAVFYGHPGVFVDPSHRAVAQARAEGYRARMLPGVSAEDCLFADLGLDPGLGCHSYEATDFVLRGRTCDPSVLLVLWQVGALGESSVETMKTPERMQVLADLLRPAYPPGHEVVIYEAARYAHCEPHVERLPIARLGTVVPPPMATLVVPAAVRAPVDPERTRRLGAAAPAHNG